MALLSSLRVQASADRVLYGARVGAFGDSCSRRPPRNATGARRPTTYLALGDSISFGYSEERFNIHFPTESPSYFEEGFTNDFAKDLTKKSEVGKGHQARQRRLPR